MGGGALHPLYDSLAVGKRPACATHHPGYGTTKLKEGRYQVFNVGHHPSESHEERSLGRVTVLNPQKEPLPVRPPRMGLFLGQFPATTTQK